MTAAAAAAIWHSILCHCAHVEHAYGHALQTMTRRQRHAVCTTQCVAVVLLRWGICPHDAPPPAAKEGAGSSRVYFIVCNKLANLVTQHQSAYAFLKIATSSSSYRRPLLLSAVRSTVRCNGVAAETATAEAAAATTYVPSSYAMRRGRMN